MSARSGSGAASVRGSIKRLEGERAEVMGLDALSDAQVYMHSRRQYDDSLSEKKMPFCFKHPRNPNVGSRSQKVWKFKRF
jgi:hypothetical protein